MSLARLTLYRFFEGIKQMNDGSDGNSRTLMGVESLKEFCKNEKYPAITKPGAGQIVRTPGLSLENVWVYFLDAGALLGPALLLVDSGVFGFFSGVLGFFLVSTILLFQLLLNVHPDHWC